MSERLDAADLLKLKELYSSGIGFGPTAIALINALEKERARMAQLEEALQQSVELQSHYAELLNMHDGGQRLPFANAEAWLDRLAALKD